LQVEKRNAPAIRLYTRFGFQEIYQYWYRVPEDLIG
jgi:ribosomal protein S18 acetylase RimI-like enzyme